MKTFKFLVILVLPAIFSCSKIDNKAGAAPEYLFFEPYLEWGNGKSQVAANMVDCDLLLDDENTLCYQCGGQTISYGFKNNKLNTVVIIPEATLKLRDILRAFNGYEKLSRYEGTVFLDKKNNTISEIENSNGFYTISWSQYGLAMANMVDLGLSVKWADVNLSMDQEDYAAVHPGYNTEDGLIGWGDPTGLKKSQVMSDYPNSLSICSTTYDVAKAKWGGKWRLASKSEFEELICACIWTWGDWNGNKGYYVTGPNGNSIFLPATGYRAGEDTYSFSRGYYWVGTMRPEPSPYPYVLNFDNSRKGLNESLDGYLAYPEKFIGCAIRPVWRD